MPRKRSSTPAEPPSDGAPKVRRRREPAPAPAPEEARAHDLLPAADPPPPQPRRVGERRVVGFETTERLLARRAFRPAGNSRRFWARVEEDDPFLVSRRPSTPEDELAALTPGTAHEVPAAARKTSPTRAPPTRAPPARAPQREPASRPEARPEPRPAAPPPPARPAPKPPARPAPSPPPAADPPRASGGAAPIDRRPPRIVDQQRPGAPPSAPVPTQRRLVNRDGRTPAEVRAETERARAGGDAQRSRPRSIDQVLSILGQLAMSEQAFREGRTDEATALAPRVDEAPARPARPAPRPPPPGDRAGSNPARPEDDYAEIEDEPPRPAPPPAPAAPKPLNRSPKAASQGASGGTLDDLFGQSEGRVKVGTRTPTRGRTDETG